MTNHRVALSDDELKALLGRLVPITPVDYDIKTFAILRNLYGRFERLLLKSSPSYPGETKK
ncbi:hypothetical protein ES703_108553 [subsurface metagenome]